MRLPIGSCPGKNAAAVLSLISATRGDGRAILVREQPPAPSGMPIAVKYSGVALR